MSGGRDRRAWAAKLIADVVAIEDAARQQALREGRGQDGARAGLLTELACLMASGTDRLPPLAPPDLSDEIPTGPRWPK